MIYGRIYSLTFPLSPLGFVRNSQSNANTYSSRFFMAEANAGEKLKMVWTPNGHQRPAQDPKTWSIHWTGKAGTQLTKRGQLNDNNRIGEPVYFDAQCDGGAGDNCYGSFTIPPGTVSGTYQFVWYWVFNRDPNSAGEEYTTCFDVKVSGAVAPPPLPSTSPPAPQATDSEPAPTEGRNGLEVVVVVTVRVPRSPSDLSANMTSFVEGITNKSIYIYLYLAINNPHTWIDQLTSLSLPFLYQTALAELLNIYNAKAIKQVQIHIDQSTMSPPMTVLSFILSSEGGIDPVETALKLKQIVDSNDP